MRVSSQGVPFVNRLSPIRPVQTGEKETDDLRYVVSGPCGYLRVLAGGPRQPVRPWQLVPGLPKALAAALATGAVATVRLVLWYCGEAYFSLNLTWPEPEGEGQSGQQWTGSGRTVLRLVELDVLTSMAKTGRLGPVFSGADWNDVTAALGEPWDVGALSRNRKWPRLFVYGDLELSVCRCRKVSLICVQTWCDVVELPASVVGGTGIFPARLGHTDVFSALEKASCSWEPYAPLTFGNQCSLAAIPSGATFIFEIAEGEEPVLNVMGLPGDGHDCSARTAGQHH
ncbi:hypothetical protein [Streptomyces sp. MN13]